MNQSLLFPDAVEVKPTRPRANAKGITPRDYQQRGLDKAFKLFERSSEGVLLASHTGSGKTLLGSLAAERWLELGPDHRVMICAHERQLVSQFAEEVEFFTGIKAGIEMGDQRVKWGPWAPKIIVASRATLQERKGGVHRLKKFPNHLNWLLILDEAHRWAYKLKTCRQIFEHFEENKECRRLGLTATPERGDGVSLRRICPDIGLDFPLYNLDGKPCGVTEGWAVPYDQRYITVHGVEWKDVRTTAGDFREEDLEKMLMEQGEILKLVEPLLRLVGNRRTIIFNPGVQMAKAVAHTINALVRGEDWKYDFDRPGLAEALDGSVPDHLRNSVYKRHQSGDFQFLSVCGLCREGYNDPGIGAVAVFRPTKSRPLAEQMKGRGCRPLRGIVDGLETAEERRAAIAASDKPNCMVIDLVGITGMPPVVSTLDLLMDGKPDLVRDLAEKIVEEQQEKGETVDLVEAAKKAIQQVKAEEDEKKQSIREQQERREREEYERRAAKLHGEVSFTEQQVPVGETGGSRTRETKRKGMRMLWGKHKGKLVADVPTGYLEAVIPTVKHAALRDSINNEINRRKQEAAQKFLPGAPCLPAQAKVLAKFGYPTNVTMGEASEWIRQINQVIK